MQDRAGVIIVEDDLETRRGLAEAIQQADDMKLLAAVDTLAKGRDAVEEYTPRVVIVDLKLPDGSGIDLIDYTRTKRPAAEIIVVSILGDAPSVLEAIEVGASGYLLKDASADEVVVALREMLAGGSPLSASIARHIIRELQNSTPTTAQQPSSQALTERELEVLGGIARGLTYSGVADRLGLSANTIPSHIKSIYRKLEVRSGAAAVFEAGRAGLIDFSGGWKRPKPK